jgi:hypothetical protein
MVILQAIYFKKKVYPNAVEDCLHPYLGNIVDLLRVMVRSEIKTVWGPFTNLC